MIDFQGLKKGKWVFRRSNLTWVEAANLLKQKKHKQVDFIGLQLYSTEGMPVDSTTEPKNVDDALDWLRKCYTKFKNKEYPGLRYD